MPELPAAKLTEILDQMAAQIETAYSSVTDVDVQVVARLNPNPTGLSIDMYPGDPFGLDEFRAFGEVAGECIFTVRARINTADHESAQDLLLALMDEEDDLCLAHALLDGDTLNGLAATVELQPPTGFVRYPSLEGTDAYLGTQWRYTVVRAHS